MDQIQEKKREWLFIVIYRLKIREEKKRNGYLVHLYIWHAHLHNSPTKVGNGSEKRKRGNGYSHLYVWTAHLYNSPPKVGNDQREKEGVVIPSQLNLICKTFFATHLLKFSWLLMNQKKGVISIDMQGPTHLILEKTKRENVLSHCYTTWQEATKLVYIITH